MHSALDRELAAFAARHHGVFTLQEARQFGLTRNEINARAAHEWCRLYEGVFRQPGVPRTRRSDLYAATRAAAAPVAISHRSAAEFFGLPGGNETLIEITCRRWKRSRKQTLVVHESTKFDERDITIIDGIPVTIPERVVIDLAGLKPYPNFVEAVIHAARRKRLITYDSMQATFSRLARRGLRGSAAVRIALERWNPEGRPTESEMETLLLQTLRAHGLPDPVLQYQIRDERGVFVARPDAAYPDWRIAIEYDSEEHHSDEFQLARDARRRNDVIAAGWRPLSARKGDLRVGGAVLAAQVRRLRRRSA